MDDGGDIGVTMDKLVADPRNTEECDNLTSDIRALSEQGLLAVDFPRAGGWTAYSTRKGREAWAAFEERRNDRATRQRTLRNVYLRWLYNNTRGGSYTVSDHFLNSDHTFMGSQYRPDELKEAGAWLADHGFIDGPGSAQRPDPIRARPTSKGADYVEEGRDVRDSAKRDSPVNYTVHGNAQIAHGSQNVVQLQAGAAGVEGAEQIAAMLDELAELLDGEDLQRTRSLAAQLRAEKGDTPEKRGRLRETGESLAKAFAGGMGGALGSGLIAHVALWLGTLG